MHLWCIVRRGGNLGEIDFLDLRVFKMTYKKVDLGARSLKKLNLDVRNDVIFLKILQIRTGRFKMLSTALERSEMEELGSKLSLAF